MKTKVAIDLRPALAGLDALAGPIKTSMARRMGVAGGSLFRDEAKRRVPVGENGPYNINSRGSQSPGQLRDAIYLAFDKENSTDTLVRYNVSWNNTKAWYGKLVEFGYHVRYRVRFSLTNMVFYTDKTSPLSTPLWVPGKAFLGSTYTAKLPTVGNVMVATGKAELPKLIAEHGA